MQLLVHQGASVNARDGVGRTPTHWAAFVGHLTVFQWLVSQGADLLAVEYGSSEVPGLTPLELAVWSGRLPSLNGYAMAWMVQEQECSVK